MCLTFTCKVKVTLRSKVMWRSFSRKRSMWPFKLPKSIPEVWPWLLGSRSSEGQRSYQGHGLQTSHEQLFSSLFHQNIFDFDTSGASCDLDLKAQSSRFKWLVTYSLWLPTYQVWSFHDFKYWRRNEFCSKITLFDHLTCSCDLDLQGRSLNMTSLERFWTWLLHVKCSSFQSS